MFVLNFSLFCACCSQLKTQFGFVPTSFSARVLLSGFLQEP